MRKLGLTLLLAAVLPLASCSSRQVQEGPLPPPGPRTTVRVDNRNFSDMTIYVLRGQQRSRLGTVSGVSTAVLEIPEHIMFGATALRFQMDPLGGGGRPVSHEIMAHPGEQVLLIIP
ncbi:MAG: hypothetical protein WD737_11125 [Gemmatimonadota bacterium]